MRNSWMVLLVVAACSKGTSSGAAGDCKAVGQAVAKVWSDKTAAAKSDEERAFATKMGPIASARLEQHCVADKWSADAIACAKAGDFDKCTDKLTAEQLDKLKASAPPLTMDGMGSGAPPPGQPSTMGSGSNSGSN